MLESFLEPAIKIGVAIGGLMTGAAYLVLLERRMAAWTQDRIGPNRVGVPLTNWRLWGLGQPMADGVKFILKEEYTPAHVDKRLFVIAPVVILAAALAVFAVVPFGTPLPLPGFVAEKVGKVGQPVDMTVAPDLDVGMVFIFALSSIAVYGVIVGGWASNNKYSFLGGLRSSAQLIAYELPMGLGILGVVLAAGSLNISQIIDAQANSGTWFIFLQPLGFVVFLIAAFAEAARLPFDLPEAEQELIGGYHTEYSGLKLLMFLVAEFLHMVLASYLITMLFLGGWHFWGITGTPGEDSSLATWAIRFAVLYGKIMVVILFFMIVRWSWPRFRFDQLMSMAWKIMLPLGILNLFAVAILYEVRQMSLGAAAANPDLTWSLILIAGGWIVFGIAWFFVNLSNPLVTDNTPRIETNPAEIDSQL